MGRSVAKHPDAIERVYLAIDWEDWDNDFWWDGFLDDLKCVLTSRYPSFEECNRWYGHETRGILENNLVTVYVSAYGGVVCIDIVPSEYCEPRCLAFADKFAGKVASVLEGAYKHALLQSLGHMSNGEQVFLRPSDDRIGNGWCYV